MPVTKNQLKQRVTRETEFHFISSVNFSDNIFVINHSNEWLQKLFQCVEDWSKKFALNDDVDCSWLTFWLDFDWTGGNKQLAFHVSALCGNDSQTRKSWPSRYVDVFSIRLSHSFDPSLRTSAFLRSRFSAGVDAGGNDVRVPQPCLH